MAAQEGKVDVVRLLAESQAQINIQSEVQHIPTLCRIMSNYCWLMVYTAWSHYHPQATVNYVPGLLSAWVAVKFMFKCIQECPSVQ